MFSQYLILFYFKDKMLFHLEKYMTLHTDLVPSVPFILQDVKWLLRFFLTCSSCSVYAANYNNFYGLFSSSVLQFLFYPGVSVLLKVSCVHWLHVLTKQLPVWILKRYAGILSFSGSFFSLLLLLFFLIVFLAGTCLLTTGYFTSVI